MEVPDYYDVVSVRLMKVLDTAELTEKIRWMRIEMWTQVEEIFTVAGLCTNNTRHHIFGSQAEATTTLGLRSDTDFLYYLIHETVLEDMQYWEPDCQASVIVMDDTTPPGYVKLQKVYDDIPCLIYNRQGDRLILDRHGRSCLFSNIIHIKQIEQTEYHGPAITLINRVNGIIQKSFDVVPALRSHSWPTSASEWITRHREHNWPSQETISIIKQSGTLLVGVGHKLSPEKHIEFRISLSYGEKILVWQFNSTQYKCYVVLKMINNHFVKKRFGKNVLTSYHWKTCMFYMIETTPSVLWQPKNVLRCIELCLMKMCNWIEKCNCPNYFIPAENMFLDKVNFPVQRNLSNMLHDLLRQNGRYLTSIPYDGIGQKLTIACQSPIVQINDAMKDITVTVFSLVSTALAGTQGFCFILFRYGFQNDLPLFEKQLSHAGRQEIRTMLQRFYCSNLGSHLASHCLKQQTIDQESLDMAYEFLLLGSSSDVASGKLKLATFYILQNNGILAENILQNIEKNYTFLVLNVAADTTNIDTMLRIVNQNISTTDIVRYYSAFPVSYLPSEMYCTPKALIPEMFRSTGSQHVSLNPDEDYWQSWAVVDPKFYLYFLQHQCYQQQNKINHKMAALSNMIWVILYEKLKYKETAFNLLAYCLKEDGVMVHSYAVLSKSMKIKNHHNAAKWQIARLVNDAFKWLGGIY
ncbi:hypothetical protein ACJMK2_009615 [Sinanodonta woodiana]|uniref:Mab-21-like HhH/H2TH-like domain-containing protein n=1 Tax=Sinanodonta woodiana TaxID=1069815 RepID=A0ABD3VCU5_SINWO